MLQSMLETLLHRILQHCYRACVGVASVVSRQLANGVMDARPAALKTGCGDEPYARDAKQLTVSALIAQDLQLLLVHSWSCED